MAVYYIYGTSTSGTTFGVKGFYSPLYLTQTEANEADLAQAGGSGTSHAHTFEEVIGVTFYMPTVGMVHPSGSDQGSAPTGQFNGETYISYTSPISDADIEPINFGVLAGDTFNSWRRKTNEVARDAILNKASVSSLDTRFSRLIDVTGGENNIMTLTSSDNITGEKEFEGLVKFTAADDSTNGIQVGANGKIYVESSEFKFTQSIDLHTASKTLKASLLDIPTGRTKYANTTYTWPSDAPIPGQILKVLNDDVLDWDFEEAVQLNVDPFLIEDPNPIGSVIQWTEAGAPAKWKLCNGQALNTYTYKDLHAVISNTYGGTAFLAGTTDQAAVTTTFNVPNMGGRIPIGRTATGGTTDVNGLNSNTLPSGGFNVLGASGGEYKHTLTVDELAKHTHETDANNSNGLDNDGYFQGLGYKPRRSNPNNANYAEIIAKETGGDLPHNIIQPYIVLNYIIKTEGSSIVVQNVTPTKGIQINNSHAQTNLLGASTDPDALGGANNANSITLDVDSEDFEFVNNQLKLVDTNYRSGEVIETFSGPCGIFTNASGTPSDADTHTRTVLSGTYRMPSCGGTNSATMTPRTLSDVGEIHGGISYKRIAGVKYIYYSFAYNARPHDNHGIWSHTPVVDSRAVGSHGADNTDISGTGGGQTVVRDYTSGVHVFETQQNNFDVITVSQDCKLFINEFTVECVDTLEEENIALSKVYWPVGSTYQLSSMIRNEHGLDHEVGIFQSYHNRNGNDGSRFNSPHLTITATAG